MVWLSRNKSPGHNIVPDHLRHMYGSARSVWRTLAPGVVTTLPVEEGQEPIRKMDLISRVYLGNLITGFRYGYQEKV